MTNCITGSRLSRYNKMDAKIPKLSWMSVDDHAAICRHVEFSNDYNEKYKNHPLMKDFASDSMVKFLYGSNSLEGTLPKNQNDDTYIMVRDHFRNCEVFSTVDDKWNADGSNQERNQIFRHFNAKQNLIGEPVLTLDNVKRVHSILMKNSVDANNKPIANGEFRTTACYSAGTWTAYPPPQCIKRDLEAILNEFNTQVSTRSARSQINAATKLFYDFLSLHPFQDGNGRVARILLSYSLERMGTPFLVTLSTGRSRSKSHINKALIIKNVHRYHDGLYGIVASSLAAQWQQFFNYIRFHD